MRFETTKRDIECVDSCPWCSFDLIGRGATEEEARADCARLAKEHDCEPKRTRNRQPQPPA